MKRARYCRISTCPNFYGATDASMFNVPIYDPSLRDKWITAISAHEPKINNGFVGHFALCNLHFDPDDMNFWYVNNGQGRRFFLKPGSIPKYFVPPKDPLAAVEPQANNSEIKTESSSSFTPNCSLQKSEQITRVAIDKGISAAKKPTKPSYCTKCIHTTNVDMQALKRKLVNVENRLANQTLKINSLKNTLNELKSTRTKRSPKTDLCSVCSKKVRVGELYEHSCIASDDDQNGGNIECVHCSRSFRATVALIDHLVMVHKIETSFSYGCDQCDQQFGMEESLQIHKMANHKSKMSSFSATQPNQKSVPPTDGFQFIKLEPEFEENNQSNRKTQAQVPSTDGLQFIKLEPKFEENNQPNQQTQTQVPSTDGFRFIKLEPQIEENIQPINVPESTEFHSGERQKLENGSNGLLLNENNPFALSPSNEQNSNGKILNQVNNRPQLRRIKIIRRKTAAAVDESTSWPITSTHPSQTEDHIPKIIHVESLPILDYDESPMLKPFRCAECDESFAKPMELKLHVQNKKGKQHERRQTFETNGMFECFVCHGTFGDIREVQSHLSVHDRKLNSKCTICRTRLTKHQLKYHLCRSGVNSIDCEYCSETFLSITGILKHLKNDHVDKCFTKCDTCSRMFPMKLLRDYHFDYHSISNNLTKSHICHICSKAFFEAVHLEYHIKNHLMEKSHLCSECGKAFKTEEQMITHLQIHSNKTLKCPDCLMTFKHPKALSFHRKRHLNCKYICNICNTKLHSKPSYLYHMFKHTRTDEDKKHACQYCPKKFFTKRALLGHTRTHTGEKPFECQYCNWKTGHRNSLKTHLRVHFGDKIYGCEKCDERFKYFKDLQEHLVDHYKRDMEIMNTTTSSPSDDVKK